MEDNLVVYRNRLSDSFIISSEDEGIAFHFIFSCLEDVVSLHPNDEEVLNKRGMVKRELLYRFGNDFKDVLINKYPHDLDPQVFYNAFKKFIKAMLVDGLRDDDVPEEMRILLAKQTKDHFEENLFIHDDPAIEQELRPFIDFIEKVIIDLSQQQKIPAKRKQPNCFKSFFKGGSKNRLIKTIERLGYTTKPKGFVDFLCGDNEAVFDLNENKLHHIAFLLSELYRNNFIKLEKGKAFDKHFIDHFSHHNDKWGWRELKDYRREVKHPRKPKIVVQREIENIIIDLLEG